MNGPLATLRLEMMQQEEKQQEIQSKCIKFEGEIQKLEEIKNKNKEQIENQNYELTLLMEKLRKADLEKESTIERVKAEIAGQPIDDTEIKQLEEKCQTLSQTGLYFKSNSSKVLKNLLSMFFMNVTFYSSLVHYSLCKRVNLTRSHSLEDELNRCPTFFFTFYLKVENFRVSDFVRFKIDT